MAQVIRPVKWDINNQIGTELTNTEEALCEIQKYNAQESTMDQNRRDIPMRAWKRSRKQSKTRVVGSMDVSALYRSCLVEPSKKKIKEAFRRSTLDFMSINKHKLCKYVAVNNKGSN